MRSGSSPPRSCGRAAGTGCCHRARRRGRCWAAVSETVSRRTGLVARRPTSSAACTIPTPTCSATRPRACRRLRPVDRHLDDRLQRGLVRHGSTLVNRAMVLNIDVDGEPVASTLTMTGREYDLIRASISPRRRSAGRRSPGCRARTMALPSFVADDGPFPGAGRRGRIRARCRKAAERHALAALYAAFTASYCLDLLASTGPIIIDGGIAAKCAIRADAGALRPEQHVPSASQSRDGTALGAALLWKRHARTAPVSSVVLDDVAALDGAAARALLLEAYQSWIVPNRSNHHDQRPPRRSSPGHRRNLPRNESQRPQPGHVRQSLAPNSPRAC